MALVTGVVLPNNGDRIKAENYNDPINKILAQVNGNLDDSNIIGLNGSKIAAGTITQDKLAANNFTGWSNLGASISAVVNNGQRSYDLTTSSDQTAVVSPGMRWRTTRGTSAPTQSTSLNGTTQYWVKTTPNKLTFTDDFVVSAWIKLSSYASSTILSRYNGTSGFTLVVLATGQIQLAGFNAGAGNVSYVLSAQSVPLNRWVHVTAQLDMSAFTATPTTSYVMIDCVDVPSTVTRVGTNPTALIQAGNLEIGSQSGGTLLFPGKIAQAAIFNAKVTQATMRGYVSQGLLGTETSLASAYSFNNVVTDLNTTTPNDLSVGGGAATATNADSPFGGQAFGAISSTLDYGVVTKVTASTITVQTPEGCTIPTTGTVTASFSPHKEPIGFPGQQGKWRISSLFRNDVSTVNNATYGAWASGTWRLTVPLGEWEAGWRGGVFSGTTTNVYINISSTALTGLTSAQAFAVSPYQVRVNSPAAAVYIIEVYKKRSESLAAATDFTMYSLGPTGAGIIGTETLTEIYAENAYI